VHSQQNIPAQARRSQRALETHGATTNAGDGDLLIERFGSALSRLSFSGESAAIALSGGGDSMALMHLFADWARHSGSPIPDALIVDHGLREGSGDEAGRVAGWAAAIGCRAHVLRWKGSRPHASIEEKARNARYDLMGAWSLKNGVRALFVAHTLDDQAETFLLRLARGSGVDGLSGMRPRSSLPVEGFPGVEVIRPLLDVRRAELRAFLKDRDVPWVEDPMNQDLHFAPPAHARSNAATGGGRHIGAADRSGRGASLARPRCIGGSKPPAFSTRMRKFCRAGACFWILRRSVACPAKSASEPWAPP